MKVPEEIRKIIEEFRVEGNGTLESSSGSQGKCGAVTFEFAWRCANKGISCAIMVVQDDLSTKDDIHIIPCIMPGGLLVDMTARQFFPDSPWPAIGELESLSVPYFFDYKNWEVLLILRPWHTRFPMAIALKLASIQWEIRNFFMKGLFQTKQLGLS